MTAMEKTKMTSMIKSGRLGTINNYPRQFDG